MNLRSILIAGSVLLALGWQHQAMGQETLLKGLQEFTMVVEDLNDHAKRCGISQETLETPVRFILQQSKMKVKASDNSRLPYIYVTAFVLESGGLCSAFFGLSVEAYSRVIATGQTGMTTVWRESRSARGMSKLFEGMARDSFEVLSKQLVADWSKVNQ